MNEQNIERLLSNEQFEVIGKSAKGRVQYDVDYPYVVVGKASFTLSQEVMKYLGSPRYIQFLESKNFIAIIPTDEECMDSYMCRCTKHTAEITMPSKLRKMNLPNGVYHAYKKNGMVVFSRYTPDVI